MPSACAQALVNGTGELRDRESTSTSCASPATATDGKAELDNFILPESRYPVIVTTSKLMNTGVDAQTCKLIVLDQRIKSMTTFKQIIGRGTRIRRNTDKFWFTIMDFKKATTLFLDPDFDGEPVEIYEPDEGDPPVPPEPEGDGLPEEGDDFEGDNGTHKIYVSGVPVRILAERVEYIGTDGKLVTNPTVTSPGSRSRPSSHR